MDTGQSSSTKSQACLQHSTVPLEDTISCDFPLALSVPRTSSRRRWIRSLKSAKDVSELQMTSPSMATLRWNMMPTYKTSCRLPTNTIWCLIHKKHVKAQAVTFFVCLYDADGVHQDPGKVNAIHTLQTSLNSRSSYA